MFKYGSPSADDLRVQLATAENALKREKDENQKNAVFIATLQGTNQYDFNIILINTPQLLGQIAEKDQRINQLTNQLHLETGNPVRLSFIFL